MRHLHLHLHLRRCCAACRRIKVRVWAVEKKFSDHVMAKLEAHNIDGDILLHIERHDIVEDLGVDDEAEGNRMWMMLTQLKASRALGRHRTGGASVGLG